MRRLLFAAALLAGCQNTAATSAPSSLPSPPPWPAPTDAAALVETAGFELMPTEGTAFHIHAHLDVYYEGEAVAVPAGIGIDAASRRLSPLHTHYDSGVVHVESPTKQDFTLGQFFTEWGVPLDGARVFVDGNEVEDPAAVVFADHQQIGVVFGAAPPRVPATYTGVWS